MQENWLKQAEEYDRIWENRFKPPQVFTGWINNDWAKGRTDYITTLIRVKDRKVVDNVKQFQSELKKYQCIDAFPERYFHLTVKELDCFLMPEKRLEDEVTEEALQDLVKAIDVRLKDFKPFEVKLEHLNHFGSNVVIQAHDGGVIREINGSLLQIPGMRKLRNDYPRFLPHLSIAQYKSIEGFNELINHLERVRQTRFGLIMVDGLSLVMAKLPKRGRYPKLIVLNEFKLG
ncbi:hypothetical protein FJY84_05810 [Candidatus Bathyarchaeota archaeon]|nr:hypothetical protein [Candidatus Bathyarchaeota archaeon]